MKSGIQIVLGVLLCSFVVHAVQLTAYSMHWNAWKLQHGKQYTDQKEEVSRQEKWLHNVEQIREHNLRYDLGQETFTMGINQLSDLDSKEFAELYLQKGFLASAKRPVSLEQQHTVGFTKVPDSVDWRTKNMVTPVKNQGGCGSCWAFSTTGVIEGQLAKSTGNLVSLSEEQLVDCSSAYFNRGCRGGMMENAYAYVRDNGIETEDAYPYHPQHSSCQYNSTKVVVKVSKYVGEYKQDENALKEMVGTYGPVAVAIDATSEMQHYRGGILSVPTCSSTHLNHGVLVVGYGSENGQDYWILKNSWGPRYGENGYVRIARNKSNMCGVATHASVPILASTK